MKELGACFCNLIMPSKIPSGKLIESIKGELQFFGRVENMLKSIGADIMSFSTGGNAVGIQHDDFFFLSGAGKGFIDLFVAAVFFVRGVIDAFSVKAAVLGEFRRGNKKSIFTADAVTGGYTSSASDMAEYFQQGVIGGLVVAAHGIGKGSWDDPGSFECDQLWQDLLLKIIFYRVLVGIFNRTEMVDTVTANGVAVLFQFQCCFHSNLIDGSTDIKSGFDAIFIQ